MGLRTGVGLQSDTTARVGRQVSDLKSDTWVRRNTPVHVPVSSDPGITQEELRLAARNHAMPLEALRWPITPVGLHYVLVHYDVPRVDPAAWRLEIAGAVDRPVTLGLDELRALPRIEVAATMECAGNGRALLDPRPLSQPWLTEAVGTAVWAGASLASLLGDARPARDAVEVVFAALDQGIEGGEEQRYERSLTLDEALEAGAVVAYEMNGGPLPPQHGFPVRLVVPGWYGMTNVKWLTGISVVTEPFEGYQVASAYRLRQSEDEEGRPVTRMRPRSLMVPPGVPDFYTRSRSVDSGPVLLEGRAWSGRAPITRVEVSTDGGETWADAELTREIDGLWAWCGWSSPWNAEPGEHVLCCRATDKAGDQQPLEPEWNLGGYENNAVQRVPVLVR
jgi:DMSO/TMAO reductase YedYZ molybdopterin-dependent catalytic subunit